MSDWRDGAFMFLLKIIREFFSIRSEIFLLGHVPIGFASKSHPKLFQNWDRRSRDGSSWRRTVEAEAGASDSDFWSSLKATDQLSRAYSELLAEHQCSEKSEGVDFRPPKTSETKQFDKSEYHHWKDRFKIY